MNVEVVLIEDNPKLGKRGEVVKVSPGFAHNFLIPNQKATRVTPALLKVFEAEKAKRAKQDLATRSLAETLAKKINETSLTLDVLVGEGEKLYGAITSQDIQHGLEKLGVSVDKKDIHLEEPIHKLGAYQVSIKLRSNVSATLKLWVVKKK